MSQIKDNYAFFVTAVIVAAELDKAQRISRQIQLTASNARALAQRAGQRAAGFRAITDFIDDLAIKTVSISKTINYQAVSMSRCATQFSTSASAVDRIKQAQTLAADAQYIDSVKPAVELVNKNTSNLKRQSQQLLQQMKENLAELARELRGAEVLATMSRVEASYSGKEYEQSLNVIAANVADIASKIDKSVRTSQRLFSNLPEIE